MSDQFPEPTPEPRRFRPLLATLTALAVLAALGGSAAYTLRLTEDADKSAPTTLWDVRSKKAESKPGAPHTGVGKLLLPVPEGYGLGPDIEEFGNDTELSGNQARAVLQESLHGLPAAQRREQRAAIDKLKVEGMALRSYTESSKVLIAEMQIAKMKNGKAMKDAARFRKKLAEALGIFRKGPKVPGYKNASCFLLPKGAYRKIDVMYCTAYQDDLLISMTAYGPRKMNKTGAAQLLKKQLDYVAGPGASA